LAQLFDVFSKYYFHTNLLNPGSPSGACFSVLARRSGRAPQRTTEVPPARKSVRHANIYIDVLNGIRAMLRACLLASASRRWCGAHTPEIRLGVILPRSLMKLPNSRTSL